jgi:hypothetical protein
MKPSAFGVNWAQIAWSLGGCGLVVGTLFCLLKFKERQREARRERPPKKEKLLRPAGYSAWCRMDELSEKLLQGLVSALGAGAVFGVTVGGLYPLVEGLALGEFHVSQVWPALRSSSLGVLVLVAVAALAWAIWEIRVILRLRDEMGNWQLGRRGEQAVAEALADRGLAAADYVAFHDVPGDGAWNVDHVVIGPGGVFVLETKARSRRKAKRNQAEGVVRFDGRVLQFPWCYDDEAAPEAERNSAWVREFLAKFPPKNIPVQPVIVVPGWYVEAQGNYPVKVMNEKYLVGYLKGAKRLFTLDQLEPVIERLDERCRTIEF